MLARAVYNYPTLNAIGRRELPYALLHGKINPRPLGLVPLRETVEAVLRLEVDIAAIMAGNPKDVGPFIPLLK